MTTALGFVMSAIALRRAFDTVGTIDPSEKARTLAEGISNAMNWAATGLIPLPIAVAVCFFAGYRLLRATRESERVLIASARTR